MKKLILLAALMFLVSLASAVSYLDAGTQIITDDVTYTLDKRIYITDSATFSGNSVLIDGDSINISGSGGGSINISLDSIFVFEADVYNVSWVYVDYNSSDCSFAFSGGKIVDVDWHDCKFNLSVARKEKVTKIYFMDVKPSIPKSFIILASAGCLLLTTAAALYRVYKKRRRRD